MPHFFTLRSARCAGRFAWFVTSLLFINSLGCFAQDDFKPKFGIPERASLEMAAYPGDSTADAVYLYDYGNVTFSYDASRGIVMTMDSWVRIKILKESALDRASVSLSFYEGPGLDKKESIEELKGFTHNLEGGQVVTSALDRKSIKRERLTDNYFVTKFNLPNVRKGSVIEYRYKLVTPINVRDKPAPWNFQGSVPFSWSEFRITIPNFLDYKMTMSGYLPLDISDSELQHVDLGASQLSGPGKSYRFVVKNAPAFVNEPYITTSQDYLSRLNFELAAVLIPGQITKHYSQTWENVEQTLDNMSWFGGELRKSSYLKAIRDEILAATKDPEERMIRAYAHVQQAIKWDGEMGFGSKCAVRKAYENKTGNAAEINLLLTALLRELELDSDPFLLSTRSNGRIYREIPLMESFNYVVSHVQIGEMEYLLDASQPNAKPGLLPEHALNGFGRLIPKKGTGRFVDITPKDAQSKLEIIYAEISPEDGSIKGKYSVSYGGYEALRWRDKYVKEPENNFHADLKKQAPEWTIQNILINNKSENLKAAVQVDCEFEVEDESASADVFYFNPVMSGRWENNPLKSSERIYPLDLTSGISSTFIGNYLLPEGYELAELPKAEVLTLPEKAGKFSYQVRQTEQMITINSSLTVSKIRFSPEEYHDLKEFFERVVQKHAQTLVIRKKIK